MRIVISLTAEATGWKLEIDGLPARQLRRSPEGFPLPPEQEVPGLHPLARKLCEHSAQLAGLYLNIATRSPGQDDIEAFGRYLFATLLGESAWQSLRTLNPDKDLELALRWAASAWELARLPWEMMRAPEDFLAALRRPRVAIVRLAPADLPAPEVPSAIPLRILFVVGTQPSDPHVQPGAEYLGLCRRLRERGGVLNSRILLQATKEKLEDAIEKFQPSIVHFICHGDWGHLHLLPDKDLSDAVGAKGIVPCDAKQLIDLFQKKSSFLPTVVIINACDSAGQPISFQVKGKQTPEAPLTVQLAQRGVPLVIGMAGRIADHACRLFTRRFYETLLDKLTLSATIPAENAGGALQVDVATATAEGRRAALVYFEGHLKTADWVFPNLVVREGRQPVIQLTDAESLRRQQQRIVLFQRREPFCDRFENRWDFERWLDSGDWRRSVFAICAPESESNPADKYGLSYLLQQFATLAVYAGFIPCMLSVSAGDEPPKTLMDLVTSIGHQILKVRNSYGMRLAPGASLEIARLKKREQDPGQNLHEELEEVYTLAGKVDTPEVLATALRLDLQRLSAEARQPNYGFQGVMVFLDAVHTFSTAVPKLHLLLQPYGLGCEKEPIPVVFSARTSQQAGSVDSALNALLVDHVYIRRHTLGPFSPEQATLAYEQFLLLTEPPRVIDRNLKSKSEIDFFFNKMASYVSGIPSRFYNNMQLTTLIEFGEGFGVLRLADDEDALRKLEEVKP